MGYEVYRVRRSFQWNAFVYAPEGVCECSADSGSQLVTERIDPAAQVSASGTWDSNPCADPAVCKGYSGGGCTCGDSGYCGRNGGQGACGIKDYMYGGPLWLVEEGDLRKEHIIARRFVVYDPTVKTADELLKEERYKILVMGEPVPGKILFPPQVREKITAAQPVAS